MTAVPFDTLKLARGLEAGGFTQAQAQAAVSALADAATVADFATKADIHALRTDLQAGEERVEQKLLLVEQRITIRFGGMLVVAVGVLIAALRDLPQGH